MSGTVRSGCSSLVCRPFSRGRIVHRERQRFVRLLKQCRRIEELDVDVGFFQDLRMQPSLLPPSIRTLTLRNCDAADTFTLLPHLPHLESLTLRLAL